VTQFVGDLEHAGDLPIFETAGGVSGWRVSGYQLAAFRSCARQLGLPVEVVLRAASTDKLGALIIEKRGGGRTTSWRDHLRRQLAMTDILIRKAELAAKLVPPWS
jgi:hypothetical protein